MFWGRNGKQQGANDGVDRLAKPWGPTQFLFCCVLRWSGGQYVPQADFPFTTVASASLGPQLCATDPSRLSRVLRYMSPLTLLRQADSPVPREIQVAD